MAKAIDHNVRKRLVVTKAMKIFAQMGYSKVSFLTISEATGIARTALYRYFKTKRELFDEAISELTGSIMIELRDVMTREIPVPRRMELVCDLVVDEFFSKRDFFLAIFDFVFSMVRVGEDIYDIELDFGVIVKAVATDDCFAWTDEDTAEVLEIGENSVTLQGVDSVTLHVLKDGKERVYNLEFAKEPMVKVTLD